MRRCGLFVMVTIAGWLQPRGRVLPPAGKKLALMMENM